LHSTAKTGPYLQYSVVRRELDLSQADGRGHDVSTSGIHEVSSERLANCSSGQDGDDALVGSISGRAVWLILFAERSPRSSRRFCREVAFQLAQRFNIFYHHHHILAEQIPKRRALLVAITTSFRRQLIRALDVLGMRLRKGCEG